MRSNPIAEPVFAIPDIGLPSEDFSGEIVELAKRDRVKAYLVGGGIASLAAAAYMIEDGQIPGENITIFEQSEVTGGSLDGAGSPRHEYVIRGGRMFTQEAYTCMFDLLSFIPLLGDPNRTVKDEIFEFNEKAITHSHSRLVRDGQIVDSSHLGLSNKDRADIIAIIAQSEDSLGSKRIEDVFEPAFFKSNFWFMWCTTFAFQTWHSAAELRRYLLRFMQELPRIHTLGGVMRTPLNQYDSIVRPIEEWLKDQGVHFAMGTTILGLDIVFGPTGRSIERIHTVKHFDHSQIDVGEKDIVLITNGSMTAGSTMGSSKFPASDRVEDNTGSWSLWESMTKDTQDFGHPAVFNSDPHESNWISFTVTLQDPLFFRLMQEFTGNAAGTGGLVTITDSHWLMSVVLPHQPHFPNQPDGTYVFWGYCMFPDQVGNFVEKKMSSCSGEEILRELCRHMRFHVDEDEIVRTALCVPCLMPLITSQFMPRVHGDRPLVRPIGTKNFAFIGQFCEMPDDVVFTVEYSVRSAQTAVYSLLDVKKEVCPIYKGQHDLGVLLGSLQTLFH